MREQTPISPHINFNQGEKGFAMTLSEQMRKEVVGRKITKVLLNRFHTGVGDEPYSTKPVFFLEDGTEISFEVSETLRGNEYGVDPIIS